MNSILNYFLYRKDVCGPLVETYKVGYQDGGCYILAVALRRWLGGEIACLVREELFDEQFADHYALSIDA
jgi:hypothetical protein